MVHKRTLAANQKNVVAAAGFLSRYLNDPISFQFAVVCFNITNDCESTVLWREVKFV